MFLSNIDEVGWEH